MEITIRPRPSIIKDLPEEKYPKFFLDSGCKLLNLALSGKAFGGGWAGQRVINIIGDTTTGKTLLACEAINQLYYNWHKKGRKVKVRYDEPEAAFDWSLGQQFGMPLDWIEWECSDTVEEFFISTYKELSKDLQDFTLIVLDSLDNLSDAEEQERTKKLMAGKETSGTYGAKKAKELKAGLRQLASKVRDKNATIIIISQVIDLIGKLTIGKALGRAGGHGLDHNASQIVWLREKEPVDKTLTIGGSQKKVKVGKRIEVKVTKNRIYREGIKVEVDILDRYGIDDIGTTINWLDEWGFLEKEKNSYVFNGQRYSREKLIKTAEDDKKMYTALVNHLQKSWDEVQKKIVPNRKPKYGY